MKQTLSLVTLAVADMDRACRFYCDGLGWEPALRMDDVTFFQMNGMVFGLYLQPVFEEELGRKMAPASSGIALAHNVASKDEVDAVMALAQKSGAVVVKSPIEREWGGYSGYFTDPDGHAWEVAWNPFWTISPEGLISVAPS